MRSFASSSCSKSSSSSTSLNNRLDTIFKKASELCTLCEIEVCVIYYGPDGELKKWPEERQKVRDIALRYSQLNEAQRHKKSVDLYGFLSKKSDKEMNNVKKKAKKTSLKNLNELKYPISDHYSPDQISQMIQSLELNISTLQERLRLVESQRRKDTTLDHQSVNSMPLNHHDQTQSLNPNQFSLFMYNHGNATLSQIPLSASMYNQDFSAFVQLASVSDLQDFSVFPLVQESGLENQLQKDLYGCDKNMCLGNFNSNEFQHPCVSNTEHYSVAQRTVNDYELSQLIQHELNDYDLNNNMCMNYMANNSSQHPCISNSEHYSMVQESVNNYELSQLIQHELNDYDLNNSMCMNYTTNNNSQHPCISNSEHYSMAQESVNNYELSQLIQHELNDYDLNNSMCMNYTTNNNSRHPCISNSEHYSMAQESVNNYELNQLMQHEQDTFTSDITNRNIPDPYYISNNVVSDESCSDFLDNYGNMFSVKLI